MPNAATYTVKPGDNLSKIAAALGITVDALAEANGIRDRDKIGLGQVLKVPGAAGAAPAPAKPGAAAADEDAADEDWAALIAKHGDDETKADFAAGKRVVIALRKPTNTKENGGFGRYDDRMIVVMRKDGALQAAEFPGNTEPSRQYGWEGKKDTGPDIDRDGKVDQGRLIAANYHYEPKPGGHLGARAFRVRTDQTAERDINQDGKFDQADGPKRIDRGGPGRTMYIHRGGDGNTWSAGCQTIPNSHYPAFLKSLGDQKALSYILIDLEG